MTATWVFPGQGEDVAPLLGHWIDGSQAVRNRIVQVTQALGLKIDQLLSRGCRSLHSTRIYQPVSTALGLGIADELRDRGIRPRLVAGHSLGELPAAAAAGFLTPEDAVRIACLRGRVMATAAESRPGGMAATATEDPDEIRALLAEARAQELLVVAAYNSPRQTVLSGDAEVLKRIASLATRLPVEGAWHSPLMCGAVDSYRRALDDAVLGEGHIPMIFNATGRTERDSRRVPRLLSDQLTRPIQWTRVVRTLRILAPGPVLCLGPSRVLRGILRDQPGPPLDLSSVETVDDLDKHEARPVH